MDIFNNREIAVAVWLLVLVIWAVSRASARAVIVTTFGLLSKRSIITALLVMILYVALAVYCLDQAGLWNFGLLKSTILWTISVASVLLIRTVKVDNYPNFLKTILLDSFKVVAILEFVVNFYTFPLWLELLVVPLITALVWVHETADGRKELKALYNGLGIVLAVLGATLVAYASYNLVIDFRSFATIDTLMDFSLPPILSLVYLPFLFLFALYINYERAFAGIRFAIDNPSLRAFAKRRAILNFHIRTRLLQRWKRNVIGTRPTDRKQVLDTITEVNVLAKRERNPTAVAYAEGWSPYLASLFLSQEGLLLGDYHRVIAGCDQWLAFSPYLEIGKGIMPNNIAYYVEGEEKSAKLLKLVLNINDTDHANDALSRFIEIARTLFRKALNQEITADIANSLALRKELSIEYINKCVTIEKEEWLNSRSKGYTLKFTIKNCDAHSIGTSA